jgi:hypothetical protein
MIETTPNDTPGGHDDGHAFLLLRKHRYTGTISYYLCWSPQPVPLAKLIDVAVARWKIEVGHRCCPSSWIGFSRLSSLSFFLRFPGFGLGRRPAGAGVVAGRAVPALAELG